MANIDINQVVCQLNQAVNKFMHQVQVYFQSLTQYELYAWTAMGVGFILFLIALITW